MLRLPLALAAVVQIVPVLVIGLPPTAAAQDPKNPDWPCPQILVPTLSPASVWDGPPIEEMASDWQRDPAVAALVGRAVDDKVDPATLEPEAEALAAAAGEGRNQKLALVFAGAFQMLDRQRSAAIASIERYARHQRTLRERIADELRELDAAAGDAARAQEIKSDVAWNRRILDDRRRAQGAVCDQPAHIEQRLGQVARMLSALLS